MFLFALGFHRNSWKCGTNWAARTFRELLTISTMLVTFDLWTTPTQGSDGVDGTNGRDGDRGTRVSISGYYSL